MTTLAEKLNTTSLDLLDLSARNKLVNTSRSATRTSRLDVVDELSDEVFRILVAEGKKMTFLANPKLASDASPEEEHSFVPMLDQPDDESDESSPAARHTDLKLQTKLASEKLQTRLLKLYRDANTLEEEQGVNCLYLALGFLRWREAKSSAKDRYAPLILVPVRLDRRSAGSKFRVSWTEDDLSTNLSLQAKLKAEFDVDLPELAETQDVSPSEYFAAVEKAIASKPEWEVDHNDMTIWFFSFSKFLMYRDLQAENWPAERSLEENEMLDSLIGDSCFDSEPPLCGEDANVDTVISVADMVHVMDADSSQSLAIEEAARGRSMVIQGPPGTGKSQTITNLIATFVKQGKKVLFVAEKMAALEVVKRRLASVGLGEACLELHSKKANKKLVLQELEHTLSLGKPKVGNVAEHVEELSEHREKLNQFAAELHTSKLKTKLTPYQLLGHLIRLRADENRPGDFGPFDTANWSLADFRTRLNAIKQLAQSAASLGIPKQSKWRCVRATSLLATDVDRLGKLLETILDRLQRIHQAGVQLSRCLGLEEQKSIRQVAHLASVGNAVLSAPKMDTSTIRDDCWDSVGSRIRKIVSAGKEYEAARQALDDVFVESAWEQDLAACRAKIASLKTSPFRGLIPSFRSAIAEVSGHLRSEVIDENDSRPKWQTWLFPTLPSKTVDCIEVLDQLDRGRRSKREITEGSELGKRSFGTEWLGIDSDWKSLDQICQWDTQNREQKASSTIRNVLANATDKQEIKSRVKQVAKDLKPLRDELQQLIQLVKFDATALGNKDLLAVSIAGIHQMLSEWQQDTSEILRWSQYISSIEEVTRLGHQAVANSLHEGSSAGELAAQFEIGFYESQLRSSYEKAPQLAKFNGESHLRTMSRFRELDLERLAFARQEAAQAHFNQLPFHSAATGELGVLKHEMKKKRAHMPIRKLLANAGHAVQQLKPVFMMSPLSVAQFLAPGVLEFDVLLIDEASQVRPVDALGAIARCRQIIVVGDEKQMPPTNFFGRMVGSDDGDDGDEQQAKDLESVLGLCIAKNLPQRMLRWHYRSKYQSLIAVSNHEFYDNRLYVVPSPYAASREMGLAFHHIKDGWFDRGKTRTNPVEAEAVADAVIEHARSQPDKTLGVGCFSVAQRDAILNAIELRRREHPELEAFFVAGGEEPFFVKNLENIQGDERDVIYVSVGYAQDKEGYASMSFGPLQNDGGERRLNVLISRAKERCEVFSTITADYIDTSRAKSRGARALKTFLSYAKTRILDVPKITGGEFDSEFERQVARALVAHGYNLEGQVGVAGFFIDLAVIDDEQPGRFLIGIECDGAQYHSSRSARDRDRLRQQVLESRGWIIYRVWSTDWFNDPESETRKVIEAIESSKRVWDRRDDETDKAPPAKNALNSGPAGAIEREAPSENADVKSPVDTVPYELASVQAPLDFPLVDAPVENVAQVVRAIVRVEGPIHVDQLIRRTASAWSLSRAGNRIRDAVSSAISYCESKNVVRCEGAFCRDAESSEPAIRDRSEVESADIRKPEYIPPSEIEKAALAIVKVSHGIQPAELTTQLARLLGFKSSGKKLREAIEAVTTSMLDDGRLSNRQGKLYL